MRRAADALLVSFNVNDGSTIGMTYVGTVAHAHGRYVEAWDGGCVPPVGCPKERYLLVHGELLEELVYVCIDEGTRHGGCSGRVCSLKP